MQHGLFLEHISSFPIFKTDFSSISLEIYLFLCFIFLGDVFCSHESEE